MATRTITMIRDAGTGETVTKAYAAKHPKTTVTEHRIVQKSPPPKPAASKKRK